MRMISRSLTHFTRRQMSSSQIAGQPARTHVLLLPSWSS